MFVFNYCTRSRPSSRGRGVCRMKRVKLVIKTFGTSVDKKLAIRIKRQVFGREYENSNARTTFEFGLQHIVRRRHNEHG